ncbi:hypothetical protein M8C13_30415 [Crossiella sp. SN42]|uniref:hypothetical protein n=1 Tax=Crossiella sp. SN42 TaxID=2944808 RepID=UPI00207C9765|nr:hypothetical protein [Crossiella sp. SN42]MCO1580076.1 hypothetical protein [Crossiella sp. SN42]
MPLPLLLLAAGVTAGGLTAAGLITSDTPRPEGHSGDQIYKWFHEEAKTPSAGLVPIERIWAKAATDYELIRDRIEKVIKASHGVWQGEAAEAARRQLSPLAGYADTARTMAEGTAKAVAQQTIDWYGCKNRLKPVPADPPQDNLLNKIQPYTTDLDRQIEQFRAGTADNQLVLAGYGERKNDNVTKLPNWTTPQEAGGDVSVVRPGGGGGRDGGRGRPGGGRTGGGYGRGVDGPGGGTGPGSGGGTGPGPVVPGGDRTDPAGWVAPQGGPAGVGAGGGAGLGGGEAGLGAGGTSSGPGATSAGAGGSGAGFGAAGVGRGFGPGGSGSGTPGAGRPGGAAGVGRAGGPGASPAGSGAARPGSAALHGMPLAAGAPREEDQEHERPTYLLETEDLFGDNRSASPPVIGEP